MTNYEKLFQAQMQDPQFVNAYYEARVERIAASSDRISRITHRLSETLKKTPALSLRGVKRRSNLMDY